MSARPPIAIFALDAAPRSIAFHPNDRHLLLTYEKYFSVCVTATGETVWSSRFERGLFGAVLAEEGHSVLAAVGPDEPPPAASVPRAEHVLVRVSEEEGRRPLDVRASSVLAPAPDGSVALLHYGDGELGLFDLRALVERTRFVLAERAAPHWLVRFGALSRGGEVAVTSTRRGVPQPLVATIQIWHTAGTAQGRSGNAGGEGPVAISPNGRFVLYGSGRNAVLWNVEKGGIESPMSLDALAHDIAVVDFELDGRRYLYGGGDRVEVVKRLPGKPAVSLLHPPLEGVPAIVRAARFSHDGRRVVTAAADGRVSLWDVT